MMRISFPFDQDVWLELPDAYLQADGSPYPWFDQYKFNISHNEPLLRCCVSSLMKIGLLDRKQCILDAGAFIGDNALPWAKTITGTVFAIDPSPTNIDLIRCIAELNGIRNVEAMPLVLSHDAIELSFNGSVDFNSFSHGQGDNRIMGTSLDLLLKEGRIGDIGLLHLDVEGSELDVIRGGMKLINTFLPFILFEQHVILESHLKDITKLLERDDYTIFMIDEVAGANLDCRNFLAIPARSYSDFSANFPDKDMLISRAYWDDEIKRIATVLEIEKKISLLSSYCRHDYEIAKTRACLDVCIPCKDPYCRRLD